MVPHLCREQKKNVCQLACIHGMAINRNVDGFGIKPGTI